MPRAGGDLPRAKALLVDTFTEQLLPLQAIARQLSQAHAPAVRGPTLAQARTRPRDPAQAELRQESDLPVEINVPLVKVSSLEV